MLNNPSLRLTDKDQAMLAGELGPASQLAMRILVQMAQVYGAQELLDISAAHIDSTIYIGEAGLEYAERLAALGAKVAVPTTLNVSGLDEEHWQDWAVPPDWAHKAHRQMVAYASMGAMPTWTCAPYQTPMKPVFGQQIAWGESNAIVYANSVLGARTERYPDLLDICCAITGRAPATGLHLEENRGGDILIELVDVPVSLQESDIFYPVLGTLMGKLAGDRIPVIANLEIVPTDDQLKALGAAAASSGAVAMFHIVGVTPEAPTLAAAFHHAEPAQCLPVTLEMLTEVYQGLSTSREDHLDFVAVGCPHFSFDEIRKLAELMAGRQRHPDVRFIVTTNRRNRDQAREAGYLDTLLAFGCQLTLDTCILATPMLDRSLRSMMTNSGKFAYYSPGMLNLRVTYGSLEECVDSAVAGRVVKGEGVWPF
jgi:predicted aconitase